MQYSVDEKHSPPAAINYHTGSDLFLSDCMTDNVVPGYCVPAYIFVPSELFGITKLSSILSYKKFYSQSKGRAAFRQLSTEHVGLVPSNLSL